MKKIITGIFALLFFGLLAATSAFAQSFSTNFDTISSQWGVDRAAPATFASVANPYGSGNVLQISASGADYQNPATHQFYNTQGEKVITFINAPWTESAQLYLTEAQIKGTSGTNWATSLWARTSPDNSETQANYPIIRVDDLNGAGAVAKIWDDSVGYVDAVGANLHAGWNDLSINGSSTGYSFSINGNNVYNDTTYISPTSYDAGFIQIHNLGANQSQTQYWDNFSVKETSSSVPDNGPGAALYTALAGMLIVGGIKIGRDQRQKLTLLS